MKKTIIVFLLLITSTNFINAQTAEQIIDKAILQMSSKNAYKFKFKSVERINGELINSTMLTKVMYSPSKVYINNIEGKNKGKELLYVKGENKSKVLVNVAWGLSLSPFSPLIRKGNHHTVLNSGFRSVYKILSDAKKRAAAEASFNEVFTKNGDVDFHGRKCYKFTIDNPTFGYIDYTIKNGESLYQIAKRLNVNETLIIEKNNNLSGFDSAKDGLKIKIPNSYAKKTIIYVDKVNYHVIYQEIYDDKGLFEKYSFINLVINPTFAADEFTEDFADYKF